jgi:predicted XRE-type DNA-binding protein
MKLISVKPLMSYELELLYSDFVQVMVSIAPLIVKGKIFKPLEDKKLFMKAKISEAGDAVTWPGDIDLDAQNLRQDEGLHQILSRANLLTEELRRVLTQSGLTQAELARRIGTKQPNIARLLQQDYQGYSVATLQKIAEATGKQLVIEFRG